jgi:hypothetical protein
MIGLESGKWLTVFEDQSEVDDRVEGERRNVRSAPPFGSFEKILLKLDPP